MGNFVDIYCKKFGLVEARRIVLETNGNWQIFFWNKKPKIIPWPIVHPQNFPCAVRCKCSCINCWAERRSMHAYICSCGEVEALNILMGECPF